MILNTSKLLIIALLCFSAFSTNAQKKKKNYTETIDHVSFDMIFVKGGTFEMGDRKGDLQLDTGENPSLPIHDVTISDFFVGKFEVTQQLWETVMGSNPSEHVKGGRPVENVSWNDCQEFIKKLNTLTGNDYRLLTESEWEYVVRGGKKYNKTNLGRENIPERAWILSNSDNTSHTAGTRFPNELGIYDLQGNVWEWVNDYYAVDSYKQAEQTNPQGVQNGKERVYRGGSFLSDENFCRPAYRNYDMPDIKQGFLGLRVARSL
ncbi:formylglycine-generating enzyme family protein [Flammeovirga agarivorans]|uniref:Formylglycine-generating enzyme family protein n=1 Tax=Flammeovirga agarivorans TaxID=2726742 RepID=A0A7X8XV37_9BACT|nr:SUMF1/EgtB/PvdO family nonheme iron enzyme [Flammeovirga agarivorans]NLR90931.1 formylglycine-generating enzyme family protein [Flammeovirga agarivorans]